MPPQALRQVELPRQAQLVLVPLQAEPPLEQLFPQVQLEQLLPQVQLELARREPLQVQPPMVQARRVEPSRHAPPQQLQREHPALVEQPEAAL